MGSHVPPLPPKTWFRVSHDSAFVEKRRQGLDMFISSVIAAPELCRSRALLQFLRVPENCPRFNVCANGAYGSLPSHPIAMLRQSQSITGTAWRLDADSRRDRLVVTCRRGSEGNVSLWRFRNYRWQLAHSLAVDSVPTCVCWQQDDLVVGTSNGSINTYRITTQDGRLSKHELQERHRREPSQRPNEQKNRQKTGQENEKQNAQKGFTLLHSTRFWRHAVESVFFDEVRECVSCVSVKGFVALLNADLTQIRRTERAVIADDCQVLCSSFDPIGSRLFLGTSTDKVVIVSLRPPLCSPGGLSEIEVVGELCGHVGAVRAVRWAKRQRLLFSGGEDCSAAAWTCLVSAAGAFTPEKVPRPRLQEHFFDGARRPVTALGVLESIGMLVLGTFDGRMILWSLATGQPVDELQAHSGAIVDLQWHDERRVLLSASEDGDVKLWQCQVAPAPDDDCDTLSSDTLKGSGSEARSR
ncbi:MAG: hypothetical protein MHM6MM_003540 [Cercozoa sp. M6MM]